MEVSRRDFLRFSAGAAGGTALAGLAGSGVNLGPVVARAQELRIKNAKVTPSVCPYCSVGCGTLIHTIDGKIVNIEGDPRSPHNEGTLCPKGAAIFQLHVVKKTRDETFIEKLPNGKLVNMTPAIFALGGATLEVEFNHVHQKLMRGLGIVAIENQARI